MGHGSQEKLDALVLLESIGLFENAKVARIAKGVFFKLK